MKQGYQNMLSTDPDYNPAKNKSMAAKAKQQNRSVYEDNGQEDEDDEYEPMPKFQIVRIVFGVLSIIAFSYCAYHGFLAGLDNIASGSESSSGMTYIILALCMLVAGLLLLIMQRAETIFAFLLPMACYLGGGVYAFLNRGDISLLLYIAIACAVLTVLFLILAVISRFGSDGYDSADGYDDSYEDE